MADYNSAYTGQEIDAGIAKANAAVPGSRTVNGKALSADVTLSAADVGALPTSGGTLTGDLTGKYITGTWLQSTATTDLGAKGAKFAVFDGSGWLYYRTAEELRGDIGAQANVTGGASTITSSNLTANRALVSNGSGKVAVSAVTSTELGYLDGVTSNIQTQINAKASTSYVDGLVGDINSALDAINGEVI